MAQTPPGSSPVYDAVPEFSVKLQWAIQNANDSSYAIWVEKKLKLAGSSAPTVNDFIQVTTLPCSTTSAVIVPEPNFVINGFYNTRSVDLYFQVTLRKKSDNSRVQILAATKFGPYTLGSCNPNLGWSW